MLNKNKPPKVQVEDFLPGEGGWTHKGYHWDSATLYRAAEGLKPFDLPLAGIDMNTLPWNFTRFTDYIYHAKRVEKADIKYPIILDPDGTIIDGWHRIAKAVLKGNIYIKAVRLTVMPIHDREDD